jgi:hypothetical protein
MLNALVQLSTLMYGAVFNFLAPAVFGLTVYGEFIAHNAAVFLLHRAMTIISEPLIRFATPQSLLVHSMVLNLIAWGAFALASQQWDMGSIGLLLGMLISASVLLAMQALRLRRSYIAFLMAVCISFSGLVTWSALHDNAISLERVMEISVWGPSLVGMVYLFTHGATLPSLRMLLLTLRKVLAHVPRIISITSAMNMLTSALPLFLVPILSTRDLGLFRVATSVIQSATSAFPVSTQTLLASFVQHARGVELYRLLSTIARLYFALASMGLMVMAFLLPQLVPYVLLTICLPVFYHAILTERHLTATGHIRALVIINLAVVGLTIMGIGFVNNMGDAVLLYASGFVAYALALSFADRAMPPNLSLLLLFALCPVVIHFMEQQLWIGLLYAALIVLVTLLRHRPTRDDVKLLWSEL